MTRLATIFGLLSVIFCASAWGQLIVTPENDPDVLANEILGDGITIIGGTPSLIAADGRTEPPITAGIYSAGFFTGGVSAGIGIDEGIILATGNVEDAPGPNTADNTFTLFTYLSGDPDLDALFVNPPYTKETTILEFDFETDTGNVSFNFVFASEEYNEFLWTGVPDVLGLFVNGENIALVPGTSTYVSIETVNGGGGNFDLTPYGVGAVNPQFYNNNDPSDGGPFFNIEYDGFTDVFTAQKLDLAPGPHHLKLAIADVGDKEVDSAVFIQAHSLTHEPSAAPLTCNCDEPGFFDPPMDNDVTVKKGNRVIPLKFTLCDENGYPVTDIAPPMAEVDYTDYAGTLTPVEGDFLNAGHGDDGNLFVFAGDHWQLNLQTKMFSAPGIYTITAVSTNPDNYVISPACSVNFIIE